MADFFDKCSSRFDVNPGFSIIHNSIYSCEFTLALLFVFGILLSHGSRRFAGAIDALFFPAFPVFSRFSKSDGRSPPFVNLSRKLAAMHNLAFLRVKF
jgi:hypothetical protein